MQCKAMQSNAKQSNALQCNLMQGNAKRNAVQSNANECKDKQCNAMRGNAKQCNAMQCTERQPNTRPNQFGVADCRLRALRHWLASHQHFRQSCVSTRISSSSALRVPVIVGHDPVPSYSTFTCNQSKHARDLAVAPWERVPRGTEERREGGRIPGQAADCVEVHQGSLIEDEHGSFAALNMILYALASLRLNLELRTNDPGNTSNIRRRKSVVARGKPTNAARFSATLSNH